MDSSIRTDALILRSTPSGDADLILHALTKSEGKISCIAKHARRGKKGASIPEPLDFGLIEIKPGKGSLMLLRSFAVSNGHSELRKDLAKMSSCLLLCEASDFLIPEQAGETEELLRNLLEVFKEIEAAPDLKTVLRLCYLGLSALLDISGYLDLESLGPPSSHNLLKLIALVENTAHRKLNTKSSVEMIIGDLRKSA